jgi:hypothetical protein
VNSDRGEDSSGRNEGLRRRSGILVNSQQVYRFALQIQAEGFRFCKAPGSKVVVLR